MRESVGLIQDPIRYGANDFKEVKPFIEIYEHEIVFYALQRKIPFQSEECPYTHESIRTDIREFISKLEKNHAGIKYNAYNSMMTNFRAKADFTINI